MEIVDWAAVASAVFAGVAILVTIIRARRAETRLAEVEGMQQLTSARQATARVVTRWHGTRLRTLSLATDPNITEVAASAKRWRHAAISDQEGVRSASAGSRNLPYHLIAEAIGIVTGFEEVIDPIEVQWARDENRLWQDDPGWKLRLGEALTHMQEDMDSVIDRLDQVTDQQLTTAERGEATITAPRPPEH